MARRVSIASASGDYVAFLDHDDLWLPDKLERQLAAATADPSVALLFSDCEYIDERGTPLGRLSDQYRLADLDLKRGVRRAAAAAAASCGNRPCSRRPPCSGASTASIPRIPISPTTTRGCAWRGATPCTTRRRCWRNGACTPRSSRTACPDVTLADHRRLLGPLSRTASIPKPIRIAMGDRLLGQHRVSCRALLKQRRFRLAMRAAFGMFSYPDRLRAFCLGWLAELRVTGRLLIRGYNGLRRVGRGARRPSSVADAVGIVRTRARVDRRQRARVSQTGYFSLVSELIRTLLCGAASFMVCRRRRGGQRCRTASGPPPLACTFTNRGGATCAGRSTIRS